MIKPEEIEKLKEYDLDKIEEKIDESIKSYHGWYPWEEAILDEEYPLHVRDALAKRYKDNGWKFVYHVTTSETGEKSGLTSFKFSMEKLDEKNVKGFHLV